jgi:uncharacterized membrane protein
LTPPLTAKHPSSLSPASTRHLWLLVATATSIFLLCSSIRHALFQSSVWDLGIFDQFAYLIGQGLPPFSSFLEFHLLGDHAAYSFYLLGGLYALWADVHWLLLVQAIALAGGIIPVAWLAIQAGAKESQAITLAYAYLLYPLIFNVNLFDFHPEVMALPVLLLAIWYARQAARIPFLICVLFVLGCKAVLSLTLLGMGIWLLIWERKRFCGITAILLGTGWFWLATQVIIPHFRPFELNWLARYDSLGNSIFEVAWTLLTHPSLIAKYVFTGANLEYVFYLVIPLAWGLRPRYMAPLMAASPILFINLISDSMSQKNLIYQYSLPILPFLLVVVIDSLGYRQSFIKSRRAILCWSIIGFMVLAKYSFFWSKYLESIDTWKANRTAITYVNTQDNLLTTHHLFPHLSHRVNIQLVTVQTAAEERLQEFKQVLVDSRHPGDPNLTEVVASVVTHLQGNPQFEQRFAQDGVYFFVSRSQVNDSR